MSVSDLASGTRQAARYPLRGIGMFALTAILGPPIGALLVLGPLSLALVTSAPSYIPDYASAISNIVLVGYTVGGMRAVFAGLWVGISFGRAGVSDTDNASSPRSR